MCFTNVNEAGKRYRYFMYSQVLGGVMVSMLTQVLGGIMVSMLTQVLGDVMVSMLIQVKSKTIKFVFAATPLNTAFMSKSKD
jgi:5-bromo-4-chloroindolyl phosphate hydrolysis protein